MLSTMLDAPLSIADLLRYGSTVHGGAEVVTWTADGPRRQTYAEIGRRCARLAHALRKLGVTNRTQAVLLAGRLSVDPGDVVPPPEELD